MIEIPCLQGSDEWLMLRAGLPTASEFSKIVTSKGMLSKSSRDYKAWLLAERIMHRPLTTKQTAGMIRGTQFEQQAVDFFVALKEETRVRPVGFVVNDAKTIGASPDRWCGDEEQWEIKVPEPQTHCGYMIAQMEIEAILEAAKTAKDSELDDLMARKKEADAPQSLAAEYKVQTMGQLWVTGRKRSALLAYSPEGMDPVYVPLKRDEPFIQILGQAVSEFSRDLEEAAADLVKRGVIQL